MRRALFVVAVAAVSLALPASASAVTFGSNLSAHAANSNLTCGDFNIFQYAGRVGCSAYTTGNASSPGDTSATHVIPFPDPRANGDQHGTITQVTFKQAPGAPAGPARLSVVEYIRDASSLADPGLAQDIADSANFTMAPGADGLVHVATNLPTRSLYNRNDNSYRYDVLVLSMLDNTTPIPADLNSQFLSGWISPYVDIASTQGDLTVPLPPARQGTGCCGFGPNPFYALGAWYALGEVLMQAELTIDQTRGDDDNAPPATVPTVPAKPVTIGRGQVTRNTASLSVTCAQDTSCAGLVQLLSRISASNAKRPRKRRKPTVYGRARFLIPAHETARVKIKLTKAGKKLLKRRTSARILAKVTVGSQVTTGSVKLTRTRRGTRK
jgi:hypothetical protein